ncbi:MAG: hypothetical protein M0Z39_01850 [Actinomycetota bacterium]|jgi:hypothetical protein|nr:hypothetical protein [Actinomycetota bacterium]
MKIAELGQVSSDQIFYMRCTEHRVDLDGLRRWSDELDSMSTEELIERDICPACPPWYIADGFPVLEAVHRSGWLDCDCCGTSWRVVPGGWEALCGDGLLEEDDDLRAEARYIEPGMRLTSSQFEIDTINPVDASLDVLFGSVQRSLFGESTTISEDEELTRDILVFSLEQALWDMENADSIGDFIQEVLSNLGMDSKRSTRILNSVLSTFLELRRILEKVGSREASRRD